MWSATCASVDPGRGWPCSHSALMLNSWSRCLGSRPRRAASALRPAVQLADSWATKPGTNVTMQTPPLSASRASTSSGTLRGLSQSARAEE